MHKQTALRQMVYLAVKELSSLADDVIMVTSSIMKDMQPNLEVIYRPNAIRALCRVIDVRIYMLNVCSKLECWAYVSSVSFL